MTVPPPSWSASSSAPPVASAAPAAVNRTVARPVANLGNTCYMNCILQALAHAPELLMGMDCEPHRARCPTAAINDAKRRASRSSSPEDNDNKQAPRKGTRKSRRRSSPSQHNSNVLGSGGDANNDSPSFCALCEVEEHLQAVHDHTKRDKPVVPTSFVQGFIDHVAPWFKLGVQEDSHEFLRLLIDAMQKSCVAARANDENKNTASASKNSSSPQGSTSSGRQLRPRQGRQEDTAVSPSNQADDDDDNNNKNVKDEEVDNEYPFSLFRGTVESTVTCESCKASSSTRDPIEDVGLEVTVPAGEQHHQPQVLSSGRTTSSSRTNSPVPTPALADVQSAFARFARPEALDAGYKCEKCGKEGRATKQSHLAFIPPILTVQLKRFRYGDVGALTAATSSRGMGSGGGAGAMPGTSTRSSTRTHTRGMNNEVNQLLASSYHAYGAGSGSGSGTIGIDGSGATSSYWGGKSGSAKIEGHIKFDLFFDLKPYLTSKLQKMHKNMFCRLFAVVVHCGKNSHSGHYLSYVRNVSKNEWWKMDDGRVSLVPEREVMQAEAYMLFYRVVQHPIAQRLDELNKQRLDELNKQQVAAQQAKVAAAADVADKTVDKVGATTRAAAAASGVSTRSSRKRSASDAFEDGYEWSKAKTSQERLNIHPSVLRAFVRKCQTRISENAAKDQAAKAGRGSSTTIGDDDVVSGMGTFRTQVTKSFYNVAQYLGADGLSLFHEATAPMTAGAAIDKNITSSEKRIAVVEPEDADLL